MGTVASALESAKKTLASANKFQSSAGGPMHSASYSQARTARATPKSEPKPEPGVGAELQAKADNINQYANAPK